jgi:hypothetical protein
MTKTPFCYFTGTGNTLAGADCIGLLSPVYAWGLPRRVARFLQALRAPADACLLGTVTCGGGPGPALLQVERLLKRRGRTLSAAWTVRMPFKVQELM